MDDIHRVLNDYKARKVDKHESGLKKPINGSTPTFSEVPDVFFDEILVSQKFTRVEVLILMYLYRQVWCRPNLYKVHGVSPLLSHTELSKVLHINLEEIYHGLRGLEDSGFIEVFRTGQYFVRRFFTKELDEHFSQTYGDFEL